MLGPRDIGAMVVSGRIQGRIAPVHMIGDMSAVRVSRGWHVKGCLSFVAFCYSPSI